jgi:hypothetical protein
MNTFFHYSKREDNDYCSVPLDHMQRFNYFESINTVLHLQFQCSKLSLVGKTLANFLWGFRYRKNVSRSNFLRARTFLRVKPEPSAPKEHLPFITNTTNMGTKQVDTDYTLKPAASAPEIDTSDWPLLLKDWHKCTWLTTVYEEVGY